MNQQPLLSAVNLHKTYRRSAEKVQVLRGLDLEVHEGEFLSVIGSSGSGKSTMLHLMCTLDKPDDGAIYLEGRRIDNLPAAERDQLRNRTFGFIFQFYHLLPELNALENVLMPQMIMHSAWSWWKAKGKLRKEAAQLLERVGLGHRLKHRPKELSGGEMQRAAIARALVNRPRVLLADEPTGNLDSQTGKQIVEILRDLNRREGLTIVMVTHNLEISHATDRVVKLVEGRVEAAVSDPFADNSQAVIRAASVA
ncbi:MAG: ABC transporter ATP-binding protein [Planctomycetes bacterium]|nr:ABC transporter ATP-binding protein [Planctomycetota bacterium]